MSAAWPQPLEPVTGPFPAAKIDGAAGGMGDHGPVTCELIERGHVPPDLVCGMTLLLLARQPRPEPKPDTASKLEKASPIAGGVWVRERFTIHRPLAVADPFTIEGASTGRYVHKGRRYGTTVSTSCDSDGRLVASNLTTGLLSYRTEEGAADAVEGQPLAETPSPEPDRAAAASNPHLDALANAAVGDRFGGEPLVLSLAMMAARDTENPDNPIHSDLEAAKQAGLRKPIAGGSHVLSFALEPVLAAFGPESLSWGAHIDARWRIPTEADDVIVPTAVVTAADSGQVTLDLEVALGPDLDRAASAMVATIAIPLPA